MTIAPEPAMRAARQQTGAGRIGAVGPVFAILLTATGVVLLHDALSEVDSAPGRTWLAALADGLDGFSAQWWLIPAGVAVALIGMWLIVAALRPRSRRSLAVVSETGVFLRTRDVARLASAAADDVDGVLAAHSVAGRRSVTVTVDSDVPGIADRVRETVDRRLDALVEPMAVKVRVRSHFQPRKGD
ncbi:DUF6286 domain-containing protein [Cryptosporangium arvum]|uniref:DUF6286 domain-containing protein n=1 Tax=Cryptosporangium arvum TaxID=80871 RepID=UPI0004BABA6F|nr:DUF6286 domain-containing protein [Cryptosporangium arvum]